MKEELLINELADRTGFVLKNILGMKQEEVIKLDADLVEEVGLDSIEAFELLATMHELLGERIPETLDRNSMSTLTSIAEYIARSFQPDVVEKLLGADIAAKLADLKASSDELLL